jgi:hypothetical protein
MLFLLRQIRRKLLTDNKVTTYLLYAIGEIFLVVVGILIAVNIDDWNETSKRRQQEIKYLKNLVVDLSIDLENLDLIIDFRDQKIAAASTLLKLKPPETIKELTTYDSLMWKVSAWTSYTPRTNTIDELISSGNFNLLSSDSIKTRLLDIRQLNLQLANVREHMRREYDYYIYDRQHTMQPLLSTLDIEQGFQNHARILRVLSDEEAKALQSGARQLLNDLTFRNGLKLALLNNNSLKSKSETIRAKTLHLKGLIEIDISR